MVRRKPGKNGLGNGWKQPWTGLKWTGNGQEMIVYGFCWLILSCAWKWASMDESGWWKWTAWPVECDNKMVSAVKEMVWNSEQSGCKIVNVGQKIVWKHPGNGVKWSKLDWNGVKLSNCRWQTHELQDAQAEKLQTADLISWQSNELSDWQDNDNMTWWHGRMVTW